MNLGTPSKLALAAVLLVISLGLFVRTFMGGAGRPVAVNAVSESKPATGPAATPRAGRRLRPRPRPSADPAETAAASLDPRLRLDLLTASERTEYKGAGRNIFRAQLEIPTPVENPVKKETPPPPNPGPPPPPPINLKFFGFASHPGEPKRIFLSQGEDVFIAGEGDIVARRYRVLRISANSVEIEDMLNNNRQTIPLTQR